MIKRVKTPSGVRYKNADGVFVSKKEWQMFRTIMRESDAVIRTDKRGHKYYINNKTGKRVSEKEYRTVKEYKRGNISKATFIDEQRQRFFEVPLKDRTKPDKGKNKKKSLRPHGNSVFSDIDQIQLEGKKFFIRYNGENIEIDNEKRLYAKEFLNRFITEFHDAANSKKESHYLIWKINEDDKGRFILDLDDTNLDAFELGDFEEFFDENINLITDDENEDDDFDED